MASNDQNIWAVGEVDFSEVESTIVAWSWEGSKWSRSEGQRAHHVGDVAADPDGLVVAGSALLGEREKAAIWRLGPRGDAWKKAIWKAKDVIPFVDTARPPSYKMPSEDWVWIDALAWRDPGWIAMGDWTDASGEGPELRVYSSRNAGRWSYVENLRGGEGGYVPRAMVATPQRVVSVGETGIAPDAVDAAALSSLDGEHWPDRPVELGWGALADVVAFRNSFVAGGWQARSEELVNNDLIDWIVPMFAISEDGADWQTSFDPSAESTGWNVNQDVAALARGIAAADDKVVAVGQSNDVPTIWTSSDGRDWAAHRDLPSELSETVLMDVSTSGSSVVVAGVTNDRRLTLCGANLGELADG